MAGVDVYFHNGLRVIYGTVRDGFLCDPATTSIRYNTFKNVFANRSLRGRVHGLKSGGQDEGRRRRRDGEKGGVFLFLSRLGGLEERRKLSKRDVGRIFDAFRWSLLLRLLPHDAPSASAVLLS